MAITVGTRLGAFEIVSMLGAGGMGEVYRARDTRLRRDVALKVVHSRLATDEYLPRLRREAHVLAALNHPHIAAIYELEEVGGTICLVMELVPGDTLQDHLARGAFPLPDVLTVCDQIAEALEAAHEKGIVHRDLKPGNIKITDDGTVKVLDFGLATMSVDLASVDALTVSATASGTIVGTLPYMSPEQARGRPVDKRTDVWAFGCVMYEMLSGRRAFGGATASDVLARIIEGEPDWSSLPDGLLPAVHRLLRRCLQKDPKQRIRDIGDARLEIEEIRGGTTSVVEPVWASRRSMTTWLSGAGLLAAGAVAGALMVGQFKTSPAAPSTLPGHFMVQLAPNTRLAAVDFPAVAVSPDGSLVAYVATSGGQSDLFVRPMNSVDASALAGTTNATAPFFSPDSRWIAFFADGQLKKISTSGGPPLTLCDAPVGAGGSWGVNDTIVFAGTTGSGLSRVSAAGGRPERVTQLDAQKGEFSHRWPEWLPDGRTVLYTVGTTGSWDDAQIVAQSLESGKRTLLVQGGTNPHYLPGYLVYARSGAIMAVAFDPTSLKITGTPMRVLDNVVQSFDGAAQLSASRSGVAVYVAGVFDSDQRRLAAVDRSGTATSLAAPPRPYAMPRLSPDGRRLLLTIEQKGSDLWIYDIGPGTLTQLTFGAGARFPTWNPDAQHAAFSSTTTGALNLFVMSTTAPGTVERLTSSPTLQAAGSWSPDGRTLAFVEQHPTQGRDVRLIAANDRTSRAFLASPFDEGSPRFSPDGRWLAYVSKESGRDEVYMRPLTGSAVATKLSSGSGSEPIWAGNGRELFYRQGDKMMAVPLAGSGAELRAGVPATLFEGRFEKGSIDAANYDIAPDGQRFFMVQSDQQSSTFTSLHVLINWVGNVTSAVEPPR